MNSSNKSTSFVIKNLPPNCILDPRIIKMIIEAGKKQFGPIKEVKLNINWIEK